MICSGKYAAIGLDLGDPKRFLGLGRPTGLIRE
jgi:hypothetical protein